MFKYAYHLILEHPLVTDPNNYDSLMAGIALGGKDLMETDGAIITQSQTTNSNHGVGRKLIELASFVVAADNWGYYPMLPETKKNTFVEDESHRAAIRHNQSLFHAYVMNFELSLFEEDQRAMVFESVICNLTASPKVMCGRLKTLYTSARTFGIACSWEAKIKYKKSMWVHHFFIYQNLLSKLYVRRAEDMINESEEGYDGETATKQFVFYGGRWETFFDLLTLETEDGVTRQG